MSADSHGRGSSDAEISPAQREEAPPRLDLGSRTRSAPAPTVTVEDLTSENPVALSAEPDSPSAYRRRHTRSLRLTAPSNPTQQQRHAHTWQNGNGRSGTWNRKRKDTLDWKGDLTPSRCKHGRVLLIDYISSTVTQSHRKKILAQEFFHLDSLRAFYNDPQLAKQSALRVIHVQNAPWATHYLLRKFNIDHRDDFVGTSFGRWARFEKPERRAGRPVLNGKTFRTQYDPWRGISRTAFGSDFLKQFAAEGDSVSSRARAKKDQELKFMELNSYNLNEEPAYGYDVYVQRTSVYIQMKEGDGLQPFHDPDVASPYHEMQKEDLEKLRSQWAENGGGEDDFYVPDLKSLDNSSTVIVFDQSASGDVGDTLVQARGEMESRWRRLTFYLPRPSPTSDAALAQTCINLLLKDIFKALSYSWERYLSCCETHVSILEDKIYENPADESRAPELWTASSLWLKVEKLVYIHMDVVKELRNNLREMVDGIGWTASATGAGDESSGEEAERDWLENIPEEFEKLENLVQEDLVKPTSNLSDLLYKSVEIRDSRHSLRLGASMWRLSWITFVFLPLTFLVSFFGMNVDTFESNPSIKYYFAAAVPLMLGVLAAWFGLKHLLSRARPDPLRRAAFETASESFSNEWPRLWSRHGPRESAQPRGRVSRLKWALLRRWFSRESPSFPASLGSDDHTTAELGFGGRIKRALARRWLSEIRTSDDRDAELALLENGGYGSDLAAVHELMERSTRVAITDAAPSAAGRVKLKSTGSGSPSPRRSRGRGRTRRDTSPTIEEGTDERSVSAHSGLSGAIVEEKAASSDGESAHGEEKDGQGIRRGKSDGSARKAGWVSSRTSGERLSVPMLPGRASEQSPEWETEFGKGG